MYWPADRAALRQRLGIQLQETQLSDKLTVLETIRLFRSFFQQPLPVQNHHEWGSGRIFGLLRHDDQEALPIRLCGEPAF